MTSLLTLSYLVDEEQNKQLVAEDSDWHNLLDGIEAALDDKDHRYHIDEYNHSLLELLKGVLNLTQNDDIKKTLMNKGFICSPHCLSVNENLSHSSIYIFYFILLFL